MAKISRAVVGFILSISLGMLQGMVAFFLTVFQKSEDWSEKFGDGQHTPIDGEDGGSITKAKFIGRTMGVSFIPWIAIGGSFFLILSLFL